TVTKRVKRQWLANGVLSVLCPEDRPASPPRPPLAPPPWSDPNEKDKEEEELSPRDWRDDYMPILAAPIERVPAPVTNLGARWPAGAALCTSGTYVRCR